MKQIITAGKNQSGLVVYEAMDIGAAEEAEKRGQWFAAHYREHLYAAFLVENWMGDLSPWKCEAAGKNGSFAGNGGKTLQWLREETLPRVEGERQARSRILAGYSLAGLFSLWSYYETNLFQGAVSCSGSLWYPGWEEYSRRKAEEKTDGVLYLSLGLKEEKTRNQLMAKVGDATRLEWKRISEKYSPERCILEWNPGGHFTNPEERMQRGIRWAVEAIAKGKRF